MLLGAVVHARLVAMIGESDCERLGLGVVAQPVNTVTSLAYMAVGAAIAVLALRNGRQRAQSIAYAACLASIGLGSVAFHGPQPDGSRLMHDLPILVTAVLIFAHDLHLIVPRRRLLVAFAGAATVVVAASALVIEILPIATGLVFGGAAVAEWIIYQRGLRPSGRDSQRRSYALMLMVALFAGGAYFFGRTDGPSCDPDSLLQMHGVWHLASAALFGLWWWFAFPNRREPQHDVVSVGGPRGGRGRDDT